MTEKENITGEETEVVVNEASPVQSSSAKQFHLDKILQKRLIATFIDFVLIGVAVIFLSLIPMFVLPGKLAALVGFFVSAVAATLILLKDSPYKIGNLLDGQTPGKKAMNIRVTDLNGEPITAEMSAKRNIIPALPYIIGALGQFSSVLPTIVSGLIGLLIILPLMSLAVIAIIYEIYQIYSGERNRRWGDTFAGTIVSWE